LIRYGYDASGNRIRKTAYYNQDATNYRAAHTWYVRDASGNVMATYISAGVMPKTSTRDTTSKVPLYLSELHMYGSSRLGIWSRNVNMDVLPTGGGTVPLLGTAGIDTFNRGNKFFELSNHLGNVLVTVSDRKLGQSPVNNLYTSFTADVVSATDYAPFGMQIVGRSFDAVGATAYRYGFNGKENDNEVKGEANQQDYGMRIYDPRIGKFLSVDPLTRQYPFYTPYSFAGNKPIYALDLDGAEELPYWKKAESSNTVEHVANFLYNAVGSVYNGIAGTWNSGVKYTKTASSDGFSGLVNQVNDDYKEIKDGIVSDIKNTKASDFLNTENYWNAAEDFAGILLTRKVIQVSTSAKPKLQSGNHNSIEVEKPKSADHHIATNKNNISTARGGPWTPRFKTFFDKAGLDINKGEVAHFTRTQNSLGLNNNDTGFHSLLGFGI
jgi:RHS repeat-associated protein